MDHLFEKDVISYLLEDIESDVREDIDAIKYPRL